MKKVRIWFTPPLGDFWQGWVVHAVAVRRVLWWVKIIYRYNFRDNKCGAYWEFVPPWRSVTELHLPRRKPNDDNLVSRTSRGPLVYLVRGRRSVRQAQVR